MKKCSAKKSEYYSCETAAFILGAALFILFFYSARLGVPSPDESFYYTVAQRIINGDRLIIDEWNLTQFSHILSVLPVWAFTKLTGSTDGIILFMRYVFIGIDLIFYAYMCRKLRPLKWAGVISAFIFCALIPQTVFSICYFTSASMSFMALCLILIADTKKKKPVQLIMSGVILAAGILSEPMLIFVFVLYAIGVIVSEALKKRNTYLGDYDFLLNRRTFLYLSAGAFVVFVCFMSYLCFSGSLAEIKKVLPYLFTGVEYNAESFFDIGKLYTAVSYYGHLPVSLLVLCAVLSAVFYFIKKENKKIRYALFAMSCVCMVWCYIHTCFIRGIAGVHIYITSHGFLLPVISLIWFLLYKEKNRGLNARLFSVLIIAFLYSAMVDLSSEADLGTGGMIAQIAGVYCFIGLLRGLIAESKSIRIENKKKLAEKGFFAAAGLFACMFIVCAVGWHGSFIVMETVRKPIEYVFSGGGSFEPEKLTKGPYKNLKTSPHIARIYNNTLEDCYEIEKNAREGKLAVLGLEPFVYLQTDMPYGVFSAWYEDEIQRLADYWAIFPENRPSRIYIPFYDNFFFRQRDIIKGQSFSDYLEFLSGVFDFDIQTGKSGYILDVKDRE
ncbi:MAG: hypothetical protein J1E34_02810 [Oscillospiraceae bacterium]|nr:hypothetical protein [Oscillospiraceae bacterium]